MMNEQLQNSATRSISITVAPIRLPSVMNMNQTFDSIPPASPSLNIKPSSVIKHHKKIKLRPKSAFKKETLYQQPTKPEILNL